MEVRGEKDLETMESGSKSIPLHNAIRKSDYLSISTLLGGVGYDVNSRDLDNNTPLHVAVECESTKILNLLLKNGALVNIQNNKGETPMHKAATSTICELVEGLLQGGGSVNIFNKEGYTPFHIAVSKGYKKVIEFMLDWGARVHSKTVNKQTPLHIAVTHWNCILAETLLDRGANVNAKDYKGKTPVQLAVGRDNMTMIELLFERGADINDPDYKGRTPLHLAADHWNYRIVKMLLNWGSLINSQNNKGQTALHIAVNNGDLTLVNKLLDRGALTDTFDSGGLTPLQYAVNNDFSKIMLKLLSKGADIGVFTSDLRSLHNLQHLPCCGPTLHVHICKLMWSNLGESDNFGKFDENPHLKKMCLQELAKIKTKKVIDMSGNEYTLMNVLDNHSHISLSTCRLFEIVLNSPLIDTEFPFYAFILKTSLLRIKKRHTFNRSAQVFFVVHNFFAHSVSNSYPTLPSNVRENILSRLSYVDLQNLIVITEDTLRIKNLLKG